MSIGLIGIKNGMTRIFADTGESIPVTVVSVNKNFVARLKTIESDGYSAVQVAYGKQLTSRIGRPMIGELKKAKLSTAKGLKEFRAPSEEVAQLEVF